VSGWRLRLAGFALIIIGGGMFYMMSLQMQPGGERLLAKGSPAGLFFLIAAVAALGIMTLASGRKPPNS
jgi:hypothetical protein